MKFIIDTQLPWKLARFLREHGYDSVHTIEFEDGHLLQDAEIILIATREKRTVITKDADFSDYYYLKGAPPKVLLLQFGNISNQELLQYFADYLDVLINTFEAGSDFVQFSRNGIVAN